MCLPRAMFLSPTRTNTRTSDLTSLTPHIISEREKEREMSGLTDWFWDERVWLPPNMTWDSVRPLPGSKRFSHSLMSDIQMLIMQLFDYRYTKFEELWYPIPAGILLIFIRGYVMRLVLHLHLPRYHDMIATSITGVGLNR